MCVQVITVKVLHLKGNNCRWGSITTLAVRTGSQNQAASIWQRRCNVRTGQLKHKDPSMSQIKERLCFIQVTWKENPLHTSRHISYQIMSPCLLMTQLLGYHRLLQTVQVKCGFLFWSPIPQGMRCPQILASAHRQCSPLVGSLHES